MAIRNTGFGGTDWGNEKLLYPDLNDTFDVTIKNSGKIIRIDETSDLDVSADDNSGNQSSSKTYSFSSSELENIGYLKIEFNSKFHAYSSAGQSDPDSSSAVSVKIEEDNTPSTIFDNEIVSADTRNDDDRNQNDCNSLIYYYELSPTDKSNGVDIDITISASGHTSGNGTLSSSFSNRQIIFSGNG